MQFRFPAVICLLAMVSGAASAESYSFGIVPQQAATKLARLWAPLLKETSAGSNVSLRFATAPDIPEFESRLADGQYDFAYMNPYHFTVFNEAPGYRALVRAKDKMIKGIIVVRADSLLSDIRELDGATMAFPAPAAFAATLLPRGALAGIGARVTPRYVSSHDSVYRAIAKGLYPAGGGVVRTFRNVDPEISDQLRILWTTDGYTPHAIAAHPDVPADVVARVRAALLDLDGSPHGRERLGSLKLKGFAAATDEDWDDVRALNLRQLDGLLARQ